LPYKQGYYRPWRTWKCPGIGFFPGKIFKCPGIFKIPWNFNS